MSISPAEEVLRSLENYSKQLAQLSKQIKDISKLLHTYNEHTKNKNLPKMIDLHKNIEQKMNSLQPLLHFSPSDSFPSFVEWIRVEKEKLNKNRDEYLETFARELRKLSESEKLQFRGRLPQFTIGNFKIQVDNLKLKMSLVFGGDEEKLEDISVLDGHIVVTKITQFYRHMKTYNIKDELASIFGAYVNIIRKEGLQIGAPVSIIKVMNEYVMLYNGLEHNKKFFTNPDVRSFRQLGPYSTRIIFSYLLYRILRERPAHNNFKLNKKVAIHAAAQKYEEHLWIPIADDDVIGENIMYLYFKED